MWAYTNLSGFFLFLKSYHFGKCFHSYCCTCKTYIIEYPLIIFHGDPYPKIWEVQPPSRPIDYAYDSSAFEIQVELSLEPNFSRGVEFKPRSLDRQSSSLTTTLSNTPTCTQAHINRYIYRPNLYI